MRSETRLAAFLEAASKLFAEVGYERATMTEIAERSNSSIGALYNYFPDKQAVAYTLAARYAQELEALWEPLIQRAKTMDHEEFASLFIETLTDFAQERPAYLRLLDAPVRLRRDPAARKALRLTIAHAFIDKNPSLSEKQAFLIANVSLQIMRGMMTLYSEAEPKARGAIVREFKRALALYLADVL